MDRHGSHPPVDGVLAAGGHARTGAGRGAGGARGRLLLVVVVWALGAAVPGPAWGEPGAPAAGASAGPRTADAGSPHEDLLPPASELARLGRPDAEAYRALAEPLARRYAGLPRGGRPEAVERRAALGALVRDLVQAALRLAPERYGAWAAQLLGDLDLERGDLDAAVAAYRAALGADPLDERGENALRRALDQRAQRRVEEYSRLVDGLCAALQGKPGRAAEEWQGVGAVVRVWAGQHLGRSLEELAPAARRRPGEAGGSGAGRCAGCLRGAAGRADGAAGAGCCKGLGRIFCPVCAGEGRTERVETVVEGEEAAFVRQGRWMALGSVPRRVRRTVRERCRHCGGAGNLPCARGTACCPGAACADCGAGGLPPLAPSPGGGATLAVAYTGDILRLLAAVHTLQAGGIEYLPEPGAAAPVVVASALPRGDAAALRRVLAWAANGPAPRLEGYPIDLAARFGVSGTGSVEGAQVAVLWDALLEQPRPVRVGDRLWSGARVTAITAGVVTLTRGAETVRIGR